jgi:hypothetical protein
VTFLGSDRFENTFSNNFFVVADMWASRCLAAARLFIESLQRGGQCLSCHVAIFMCLYKIITSLDKRTTSNISWIHLPRFLLNLLTYSLALQPCEDFDFFYDRCQFFSFICSVNSSASSSHLSHNSFSFILQSGVLSTFFFQPPFFDLFRRRPQSQSIQYLSLDFVIYACISSDIFLSFNFLATQNYHLLILFMLYKEYSFLKIV